jgi:hypothetical protein
LPEKIRKDTEAENRLLPEWLDDQLQDIVSHCVDISFAEFEHTGISQEDAINEGPASEKCQDGSESALLQGTAAVLPLNIELPSFGLSQRPSITEQELSVNIETGLTSWRLQTDAATPSLSKNNQELSAKSDPSKNPAHNLEGTSPSAQTAFSNPAMIHFGFDDYQQYSEVVGRDSLPKHPEDNIFGNPHSLGYPLDFDAAVFQDWFSLERPLDLSPGKEVIRALGPPSGYNQE